MISINTAARRLDLLSLSHSLFSNDKMPLQVVDQISKKRKRHAYDASFKIRVATYAIENGNNSKAAREFDEKQVRDWKKPAISH